MLLVGACGDDMVPSNGGSSGDSSGMGTLGDSTEVSTDSGEDPDSTTTTADDPPLLMFEVITYPEQPMVADLLFTVSRSGTAIAVTHPDPGVVVERLSFGQESRIRLRGMVPGITHELTYQILLEPEQVVQFDLPPPLPGFQAAFDIEATVTEPAPMYRMFDMAPFPIAGATGLFVVDPAGITRWYLGAETKTTNADAIWAAAHLLDDGTVLYLENNTIWRRDELGQPLWELPASEVGVPSFHHEIMVLPSGNLLTLGLSFQDVDYPDDGVLHVAGDTVLELTPEGQIVWEWNSFDYLDPLRVRDGFDLPLFDPDTGELANDWTHANGMVYEPETDTILVSMRHQDWILRIDHATGEVRWRLGPEGDFTLDQGRWFFHQHSPQWQPDGSLILYDNGVGDPDLPDDQEVSRVVRYTIDDELLIATEAWSDEGSVPAFTSMFAGDADRITPNRVQAVDSLIFDPRTGLPAARLREFLGQGGDATPLWTLNTPPGHFVYRATASERLVGMAAR